MGRLQEDAAAKRWRKWLPWLVASNYVLIPLGYCAKPWASFVGWEYGALIIRLRRDFLKQKGKDYGTVGFTLGHLIVLSKHGDNPLVQTHELHHCEQQEASGLTGLVVGLACLASGQPWWASALLWALTPAAMYLSASAVAWMRGEDKYRGNFWEEGARAMAGRGCKQR